jgi:predicted nuclease of restriction endonuclease-like (RecB) superfamily
MVNELTKYRDAVLAIKNAILQSRYQAARLANKEQLALYYGIGRYVSENTRSGKWGSGAIENISARLQAEMPGLRGFSATNIRYMRIFYEEWSAIFLPIHHLPSDELESISPAQFRQLASGEIESANMDAFMSVGFTHHREILINCKPVEERWYYIRRCASEYWSVEALKSHLRANDFQHSGALPNNFVLTIPDAKLANRAVRSFKDEYLLDYINIEDDDDHETSDERVLNKEIVANIQKFIMTFGDGFCFIGSEKRLIVGEQEFFIDLLFYSRNLNCLIAVELKRGVFKPAYLGQLNFYLSAMDKYLKKPHENKSIGLLLCKDINKSVVELAVQDYKKPMGVAVYRTAQDIPTEYKSLEPIIDGVQEILSGSPAIDSDLSDKE